MSEKGNSSTFSNLFNQSYQNYIIISTYSDSFYQHQSESNQIFKEHSESVSSNSLYEDKSVLEISPQEKIPVFQKSNKKICKNNNVPKHLLRKYVENFNKRGKKFFLHDPLLQKKVKRFVDEEKKHYKSIKNYNNNLESMKKFFAQQNAIDSKFGLSQLFSQSSRKYAQELIREEVIPKLKQNRQVKHLLPSYLLTLKVQMHRCRNSTLMCRTQSQ